MSDLGNSDRRVIGNGDTYWYTGYAFYAQLEDVPNWTESTPPFTKHTQRGVVLKSGRKVVNGAVGAVRERYGAGADDSLEEVFFRATEGEGSAAP